MTTKEFWDENPALMWSYRISYIKQQKIQNNRDNQLAYIQGIYNTSALESVLGNMFGKKTEYMKIIDLDKIEKEYEMTEEEKKKENINIVNQQVKAEIMRIANMIKK